MKQKLFMHALVLASGFGLGAVAHASQQLDISKVNQVIAEAKDAVLPEFAEFIKSANLKADPATFNLDKLTLDLDFDAEIKKSAWSQQATTVQLGVGTSTPSYGDLGELLTGELKAGLKTQTLNLAKYLTNKALGEAPNNEQATSAQRLVIDYLNDVLNANEFAPLVDRTITLRNVIVASQDPELAQAKEFFDAIELTNVNGALNIKVKAVEFYDIKLTANVLIGADAVSASVKAIDIKNNLTEHFEGYKESITQFLLSIQNATDDMKQDLQSGVRDLLSYARSLMGEQAQD